MEAVRQILRLPLSPGNRLNTQATSLGSTETQTSPEKSSPSIPSLEKLRADIKAEKARTIPVLKAKYGEFDERDWSWLKKADEELAKCAVCKGECLKTSSKWIQPLIRVEEGLACVWTTYCRYARAHRIKTGGRLAKIPPKYISKTFADYRVTAENERAVQIAKWLVEEKPETGAYFYGEGGAGKTFLASLVAQEYIGDGYSVIFGDAPSILTDIKATFRTTEPTADFLKELVDVDLLVIDDMGAENVSDWSAEQLYLIINGRCNAGKTTVVTSNYDLAGLSRRYKDEVMANRLTRRLRESTAQAFLGTHDWRQ